jgi:hypothetical protein
MIDKEFIPYELALELKQLGFDEPCLAFYDGKNAESFYFNSIRDASGDYIPFQKHDRLKWFGAPLYQQAFRWFREQHGLCLVIKPIDDKKLELGYSLLKNGLIMNAHLTYEGAELACLKKLIEIVNGKQ